MLPYGAAAYFANKDKVSFVISKSRLALIKTSRTADKRELTNSEGELMAALTGTILVETIISELEVVNVHPNVATPTKKFDSGPSSTV